MSPFCRKNRLRNPRLLTGIGLKYSVIRTACPDAAFDRITPHQHLKQLRGNVTSLIRIHRPLETAACQPFINEAEAVTLENETLDTVFTDTAEKEEGSILKRIQAIIKTHKGSQTVYAEP